MTATAPVITIDGPSGAGKGTLCKAMAEALQWHLLDSGAIYRVLALAALHHQVDIESEEALVPIAAHLMCALSLPMARWRSFSKAKTLPVRFALRMSAIRRRRLPHFLVCVKHCCAVSARFATRRPDC